jgi:hypothetical protein
VSDLEKGSTASIVRSLSGFGPIDTVLNVDDVIHAASSGWRTTCAQIVVKRGPPGANQISREQADIYPPPGSLLFVQNSGGSASSNAGGSASSNASAIGARF